MLNLDKLGKNNVNSNNNRKLPIIERKTTVRYPK